MAESKPEVTKAEKKAPKADKVKRPKEGVKGPIIGKGHTVTV